MSKSEPCANPVKNWRRHGVKNSFSGADYYVISRGNGRREIGVEHIVDEGLIPFPGSFGLSPWKEIVSITSTC
jgi:hypothetical protein